MSDVPGIGCLAEVALRHGITGGFSLMIGTGGSNDRKEPLHDGH